MAATSGERSARLRDWLLTEPAPDVLADVYREMVLRDKGAAKLLKEKLDELKRIQGQDSLASDWAQKAQQMLQAPRLNIADAMAWQRDAAKAGAPLSREPLSSLKLRLVEVIKGVEDLQHQVMVQREAAVLLTQRIEVLSTKSMNEVQTGLTTLQSDIGHWQNQAQAFGSHAFWPSVDLKFPVQLDAVANQLQVVWQGFFDAFEQAQQAQADALSALPTVPVWADEIRRLRGQAQTPARVESGDIKKTKKSDGKPNSKADATARQGAKELADKAVSPLLETLEKQQAQSQDAPWQEAVDALRAALEVHGKNLDTALDERLHQALTTAGLDLGWPRWQANVQRQSLVLQAEGLLDADKKPATGGRKLQDKLRQLRDSWKQVDHESMPNHVLWKRFDAACNEAYQSVLVWLEQIKKDNAQQRAQRTALLAEVKAWTVDHADNEDWRSQLRALHQFADRWRNAGHLSEKTFGEMQAQWKEVFKAAAARLEAAQKASVARRQALIDEAAELALVPVLRVDAVKALQQRWQVEAQSVPLDRKVEQKLWEIFRAPLDEAFQRKGADRQTSVGALSAHDRAVLEASQALDAANAGGDAAKIRAAMLALDAALRGQAQEVKKENSRPEPSQAQGGKPEPHPKAAEPAALDVLPTSAELADEIHPIDTASNVVDIKEIADSTEAQTPAPSLAPKIVKPVVAVRGDDRPGQKKNQAPAGRDVRRDGRSTERGVGRFGQRGEGRDVRPERGPRLGDVAFRAQREAMERAEMSLRKLATQAHGEALGRLLKAWQERQSPAVPSAQELGQKVNPLARQAWVQALSAQPQGSANTALLRLEMAAETPTPADQLSARRMLQLQLLTQRNQAGPRETWAQDVAQVLSCLHDEATERRLQTVLKTLLRG